MQKSLKRKSYGVVAGAAALGVASAVHAAPTIDGTLDTGAGYVLTSTQTQTTDSNFDSSGGPQSLPANDATATTTGNFTQLSNVYSSYDSVSNTLNLFVGGSLNAGDGGVSHYIVALQTAATGGVSGLGNIAVINGSVHNVNNPTLTALDPADDGLNKINFDAGFSPTSLLIIQPGSITGTGSTTATGSYTGFTDLTGGGATTAYSVAYNNSLQNLPVGTGAVGDPGFANASTGLEISIPLGSLGFTNTTPVLASIFTTNGGSDGRTNNQTLAPFVPNPADASGGYDYTYIDTTETVAGSPLPGRQFSGVDYPGLQYFAVPGTGIVPEPASLGLVGLIATGVLGRRARKA